MTAPRIGRARRLRAEATYAERALWDALRGGALGVRFRRQHPVGRYVADFACVPARLAIELDGAVHERVAAVARCGTCSGPRRSRRWGGAWCGFRTRRWRRTSAVCSRRSPWR